jgi:hypothetical protein
VGDSEAPDFGGSVRVESERDLDTAGPEPVNMGTPEKPGSSHVDSATIAGTMDLATRVSVPFERPQGQLTLSMSANPALQEELLHYLEALQAA